MEVESEGAVLASNEGILKDSVDKGEENKVSPTMGSKVEPSSPVRSNPSSPEPNCAICLGKLENKSFTDSCFHQFCFTCLLEWSKVKSVCPLCKTSFQSIIHNVRSIEEYDQYHVRHEQPATWENPDGRRFRYRSTLTNDRRRSMELRRLYMNHRLGHRMIPAAVGTATEDWPRRRTRQVQSAVGSQLRQQVYGNNLRAIPHDQGHRVIRYRDTTPRFFHENPACTHRLLPWLTRELNVLLYNNETHVTFALNIIMSLITRFDIRSPEFHEHVVPYFTHRTEHFVHEFYNFARSPWDMETYDRNVTYLDRPESSGSDSDVIFLDETRAGPQAPEPSEPRRLYLDVETPGPPTTENTPLERVRLFLNSVLPDGPAWSSPAHTSAPIWDSAEEEDGPSVTSVEVNVTSSPSSPVPGPSGISSGSTYKTEPVPSTPSADSDDTISVGSSTMPPRDIAMEEDGPVNPEECLIVNVVKGIKDRTPEIIDLASSDGGKGEKRGEAAVVSEDKKRKQKKKKKKKSSASGRSRDRKESRSASRSVSSSSRRRRHGSESRSKRRHRDLCVTWPPYCAGIPCVQQTSTSKMATFEADEREETNEETVVTTNLAEEDKTTEKTEKITRLPLTRIKNLMKMDPDITLASQEAVFLITKATELFIEAIATESYFYTAQAKKKTLQKKDVDSSIDAVDAFVFLEGALE